MAIKAVKGIVRAANPGKDPAAYKSKGKAPTYKIGSYNSQYAPQVEEALNKVTNWSYDPMQDASYQALAKVYGARGNIAAKNSLADAAALNGGYGTSYAVSAAQQARNQYNQELASYVPQLEQTAYERATGTLNALRAADDTAYGRFRDTEGDRQWKYTQDYQKYRDQEADAQWAWSQNYNKYRDLMSDWQWAVNYNYQRNRDLMADKQWAQNYALDREQFEWSKKANSGGGGGGSSGGGGGGYSSGGGGSSSSGGGGSSGSSSGSGAPDKKALWGNKKKKLGNGGR